MTGFKSLSLVIIFFLLCESVGVAQQHWMRRLGGFNHDEILCSAKQGSNIVYGGYFNSAVNFGPETLVSTGNSDGFIMLGNQAGSVLWAKKFGGVGPDRIYDVQVGPDNSIVICGYFSGIAQFGNITLTANDNSQDGFVCLLNEQGDVQWAHKIGGPQGDLVNSASIDPLGNVIITGHFRGTSAFGAEVLNSTINPDTDEAGNDLFISKIGAGGQFIWTKQGIAPLDDRGLDIATDNTGNIYFSAQHSDTLFLDNMYANDVYNSGILLKLNPDGEELWFRRFEAFQCLLNDVHWSEEYGLTLTGDYIGQMLSENEDSYELIPSDYTYNIFCFRLDDENADILWYNRLGSENQIASTALDLDPLGNVYLIGNFKCSFSELAEQYGSGLYYSRGYRDLIMVKLNSAGERVDQIAAGGPKDDFSSAITVFQDNFPFVGGSFDRSFLTISQSTFAQGDLFSNTNESAVNQNSFYCGYWAYGNEQSVISQGGIDMVFGRFLDATSPHYDIFSRVNYPDCLFDFRWPCLDDCSNNPAVCVQEDAVVNPRTGTSFYVAPEWDIFWNNVPGNYETEFNVSQTVICQMQRSDLCYSWTDTLIVHPLPDAPTITDSEGVNFESPPNAMEVVSCDSVLLDGGNIQDNIYWWENNELNDSLLWVTNSGVHYFWVENEYGCKRKNRIEIDLSDVVELDSIQPFLIMDEPNLWIGQDSIGICENDRVWFALMDGFTNSPVHYGYTNFWTVPDADAPNDEGPSAHRSNIKFYESGWYTIYAWHERYSDLNCEQSIVYPEVELVIYVEIYDAPEANPYIYGDNFVCPGDTVLLVATGGDNYEWSGPGILLQLSEDSILVNQFGNYLLESYITTPEGCSFSSNDYFNLQSRPHPQITMNPANGIVCPGDSVQITAQEGIAFNWIDPYGNSVSYDPVYYAEIPGFYHCIITLDDGCIMESNFVEVKEYSSPYLLSYPGTELCVNGQITLQVISNPEANIQWGAPFYNSNVLQQIYTPGTYEVSSTLCGITTPMEIVITESDTPASLTLVGDSLLCPGDSVLLVANTDVLLHEWVPGGFGQSSIWVDEPGEYYVMTYDEAGCIGISNVITIGNYPLHIPETAELSVCEGETAVIVLDSSDEVNWYYTATDSLPFSNVNLIELDAVYSDTSFWFTVADSVCTSLIAPFNVLINPNSQTPEILAPDSVCHGDEVHLETSFFTYWSGPSGQNYSGTDWVIPFANNSWNGQFSGYRYDEQCSSDTVLFNLFVAPNSIISVDATAEAPFCVGDTISYNAGPGFESYLWLPDNFNGEQLEITIPHISNTLILETIDAYGCVYDTLLYIPFANPVPEELDNQYHHLCLGESIVLSLENIAHWYDSEGEFIQDGTSYTIVNADSSSSFTVEPFNGFGCTAPLSAIDIEVHFAEYEVNLPQFIELCEGEELILEVDPGEYTYTWYTPGGDFEGDNALDLSPALAEYSGIYQVIIADAYCEVLSDLIDVTVFETPDSLLATGSEYCIGNAMLIDSPEGLATFEWEDGTSVATYQIPETGWVSVSGYTTDGCFVSDSVYVESVLCHAQGFNVFSPNNDGVNDYIDFRDILYRACSLQIFNRWGDNVFDLQGRELIWNGSNNNGQLLEEGTYFYILSTRDCYRGDGQEVRGYISLMRE